MGSTFDFNSMAGEYDLWYKTPAGREYDRLEKEMVRNALRHSGIAAGKLLEVGCGTGHWSEFFASFGFRITGIDISEKMLRLARERVTNAVFLNVDAEELPFKNGEFDIVAAITVLEFADNPPDIVSEMYRCLRSGGVVLIGGLNRDSALGEHHTANPSPPYESGTLLSKPRLVRLLENAGFKWIRVEDGCRIREQQGAISASPVHTAIAKPQASGGDFLVAVGVK